MIAVIGSGLGGLAAAVTLAQAGHPVVVFEAHSEPGGFATAFERGPYTFDASLHALDAVGAGEPNALLLARLGVLDRLDLRPIPTHRREIWLKARLDIEMPHDLEGYLERFARLFPADADGARELFSLAKRVSEAAYAWMEAGGMQAGGDVHAVMNRTVEQLLSTYLRDPAAIRFLSSMTTYLGLPGERLGAMSYLLILHGYYGLHGAYPVGGSRAITRALVAELERWGGRLVLATPVEAILCQRRRVKAVIAGGEHPVRAVVANCSPLRTYGELLPEREVPGRLLAHLRSLELSSSAYSLHIGARDLSGLPEHAYESFIHEVEHPLLPRARVAVTARHKVDPGSCPPGHGVFEIATGAPNQAGVELTTPEIRDALIDVVERHLLPGLRERVEVTSLVHPGTWLRYTGTPRGATFGFAMTPEQSGVRGLQVRTPIEGLYQAGAWIRPGAGQTAVMLCGRQAGHALIEDGAGL